MFKLICMSFDGEVQIEHKIFEFVEDAWDYSNDLGSKWFFYPFHFVVSESEKTVIDGISYIFKNKRVKTVRKMFKTAFDLLEKEGRNADCYEFIEILKSIY